MSKYLLDKFLYTVDRDPELVERYREDPTGFVEWWEREMANTLLNCVGDEKSTWLSFTADERRALREQDHVTLFDLNSRKLHRPLSTPVAPSDWTADLARMHRVIW